MGQGLYRQWQLNVVNQPFLTLAPYFAKVFTDEELNWMRTVRKFCRNTLQIAPEQYSALKGIQCLECRWRVIASYALAERGLETELPIKGQMHELVAPFVQSWNAGESGKAGLDRPAVMLTSEIISALRLSRPSLLSQPEPPSWVRKASDVQWQAFKNEA